jgi:hypothetical protein
MPPEPIHHELLKQSLDAISFQFFSIVIFKRFILLAILQCENASIVDAQLCTHIFGTKITSRLQEQNAFFCPFAASQHPLNEGKYKHRNQDFLVVLVGEEPF